MAVKSNEYHLGFILNLDKKSDAEIYNILMNGVPSYMSKVAFIKAAILEYVNDDQTYKSHRKKNNAIVNEEKYDSIDEDTASESGVSKKTKTVKKEIAKKITDNNIEETPEETVSKSKEEPVNIHESGTSAYDELAKLGIVIN